MGVKIDRSTHIQIPANIEDPVQLRRFLNEVVLRIDVIQGRRGGHAGNRGKGSELNLVSSSAPAPLTQSTDMQKMIDKINELIDVLKATKILT